MILVNNLAVGKIYDTLIPRIYNHSLFHYLEYSLRDYTIGTNKGTNVRNFLRVNEIFFILKIETTTDNFMFKWVKILTSNGEIGWYSVSSNVEFIAIETKHPSLNT